MVDACTCARHRATFPSALRHRLELVPYKSHPALHIGEGGREDKQGKKERKKTMLEFLLPYLFLLYFSEVLCLLTGTNIWILSTYDPLGDIR